MHIFGAFPGLLKNVVPDIFKHNNASQWKAKDNQEIN